MQADGCGKMTFYGQIEGNSRLVLIRMDHFGRPSPDFPEAKRQAEEPQSTI